VLARVLKFDSNQVRGIGTRGGSGRAIIGAFPSLTGDLMTTAFQVRQSDKALPPPVKDSLPPVPPQDPPHPFSSPPHLPPKPNPHYDPSPLSNGLRPPPAPIDIPSPDQFLSQGDALRSFPTADSSFCSLPSDLHAGSGTPTSPASSDMRAKRTNPLVDLIDTEKLYVEQLTGIIRVSFPSRQFIGAVSR